jgi:cytochrome c553
MDFRPTAIFCARCHGANGEGGPADGKTIQGRSGPGASKSGRLGSIVDPSYLALISDQSLRSILIAGRPDEAMPDWRNDAAQPMTDQQITDILAWLAVQTRRQSGSTISDTSSDAE